MKYLIGRAAITVLLWSIGFILAGYRLFIKKAKPVEGLEKADREMRIMIQSANLFFKMGFAFCFCGCGCFCSIRRDYPICTRLTLYNQRGIPRISGNCYGGH